MEATVLLGGVGLAGDVLDEEQPVTARTKANGNKTHKNQVLFDEEKERTGYSWIVLSQSNSESMASSSKKALTRAFRERINLLSGRSLQPRYFYRPGLSINGEIAAIDWLSPPVHSDLTMQGGNCINAMRANLE